MKISCLPRSFSFCSPSLVPIQPPSPMETHLWYVLPDEVKSASLLSQYMKILSPSEKEDVDRMNGEKLRKRVLLTRALVRTTISRYQIDAQVTPSSLKFKKNIHGKPEVDWQHIYNWAFPRLQFNISHTSSLIACGVTIDSPIGIDVEEKQRTIKNSILSFSRRYFSTHEVEFLCSILDPEVQREEFIKLWTIKEAYVKALGMGFSAAPFKTFNIRYKHVAKCGLHVCDDSSSETSEIVVETVGDPNNFTSNWKFKLLELAGSHYAAICVRNDNAIEGKGIIPMKLSVWKTIPLLEDHCVSQYDGVL